MTNFTANLTASMDGLLPSNAEDDGLSGDDESKTVTIFAAAGIALIVAATCVLLCYRELNRRRFEADLMDELARRDLIRRSVQSKIEQMSKSEDSRSYLEHIENKVPFVTFGEVTKISPSPSFLELHRRNSHHNVHDYHYHHLHTQPEETLESSESISSKSKGKGSRSSSFSSGSESSGKKLERGDYHHHLVRSHSTSRLSFFTSLKKKLFIRTRTGSDSSESGSEAAHGEMNMTDLTP